MRLSVFDFGVVVINDILQGERKPINWSKLRFTCQRIMKEFILIIVMPPVLVGKRKTFLGLMNNLMLSASPGMACFKK